MYCVFSLDNIRIETTRAVHNDSDIVALALVDENRNNIVPPVTKDIGDVNNGDDPFLDIPLGLTIGPANIDQGGAFSFSVINSGYDRSDNNAALNATNIAADGTIAAAGAVVGAIVGGVIGAGVVAGGAQVLADIVRLFIPLIFANCDGPVALDGIGVTPDLLRQWAAQGPHRETHHYTYESQGGCGASPQYDVTWSFVEEDPAWTGWGQVGEGYTNLSMTAASFGNRLFAFAIGTDQTPSGHVGVDEKIYLNTSSNGQNWDGWRDGPGDGRTDLPVAPVVFNNRLFVFEIGTDWIVYVNSTEDGQQWSGWSQIGGLTHLPVAVTVFQNRLYVFDIGYDSNHFENDQKIYANTSTDGQHWSGFFEIGGGGLTNLPVAATVLNEQLLVFAVGEDYRTYVNRSGDGGHWSGWSEVPGQPQTDLPLAVTTVAGRICLGTAWPTNPNSLQPFFPQPAPIGPYPFGNNRKYRMVVNQSADAQNWTGAKEVWGVGQTLLGVAATNFEDQPYLFAVGMDGRTYFNFRRA